MHTKSGDSWKGFIIQISCLRPYFRKSIVRLNYSVNNLSLNKAKNIFLKGIGIKQSQLNQKSKIMHQA